jgi:hypothetical protein
MAQPSASTFQASINIHQSTRRHVPENLNLQQRNPFADMFRAFSTIWLITRSVINGIRNAGPDPA